VTSTTSTFEAFSSEPSILHTRRLCLMTAGVVASSRPTTTRVHLPLLGAPILPIPRHLECHRLLPYKEKWHRSKRASSDLVGHRTRGWCWKRSSILSLVARLHFRLRSSQLPQGIQCLMPTLVRPLVWGESRNKGFLAVHTVLKPSRQVHDIRFI
jgi:hypothetical protein